MSQVHGECGSSVQLKQKRRPHVHSGSQKGSPSTRTAQPQCGTLCAPWLGLRNLYHIPP